MYKQTVKPILFKIDPEIIHEVVLETGGILSKSKLVCETLSKIYSFENANLEKNIHGIKFKNPIGLAAGFDYDGKLANIMRCFGFGFNTIGTVTAKEYEGNAKPRLIRLPKSKAILVNKGFKSQGVYKINERLNKAKPKNSIIGVSVGSSNIPAINTLAKAIDDYIESFSVLKTNHYINYFELNISCPNTQMTENFINVANFEMLLKEVTKQNIKIPIFIKMPNELELSLAEDLVKTAMKYTINSFIFSNLVKNRNNKYLDKSELEQIKGLKGNFSGKPTEENAKTLVNYFRTKYKNDIILVSCGGIFTPQDALDRLNTGADLIQLITGLIYEGPSIIKNMNKLILNEIC